MYSYPLSVPTIGGDEITAALEVLQSGHTTMGTQVEMFEEAFAGFVDADHAIMTNSGSSANLILAFALVDDVLRPARGLIAGDEVLVPAVTWPTQVWPWCMAGFRVRLVDVDPLTLNSTPLVYEAALSPYTKALSLVHLMGNPCDVGGILKLAERYDLTLTEDCCEALGAGIYGRHVGGFGVGATHSFFFSHHMTTMEGGMVTTNDAALADRLRSLRSHGWTRHNPTPTADLDPRYTFTDWGFNVRPTEVAAAIGQVQLTRVDEENDRRLALYQQFVDETLGFGFRFPKVVKGGDPSWFGVPLIVTEKAPFTRNQLATFLEVHSVETRPILGGNLARQPIAKLGHFEYGELPGADEIHDHGLFLGLHAGIDKVVQLIHKCAKVTA